jgi:hypothetical protein
MYIILYIYLSLNSLFIIYIVLYEIYVNSKNIKTAKDIMLKFKIFLLFLIFNKKNPPVIKLL